MTYLMKLPKIKLVFTIKAAEMCQNSIFLKADGPLLISRYLQLKRTNK